MNHPTSQCLLKQQSGIRLEPPLELWCDFHNKWGNYSTKNCYKCIHPFLEQEIDNMVRVGMEGDRQMHVLER